MKDLRASGILVLVLCVLQVPVHGLNCYFCLLNCNTVYNDTVPGERVSCSPGEECEVTYLFDSAQTRGCTSSCIDTYEDLTLGGRTGTHCCAIDDCNGNIGHAGRVHLSLTTISAACVIGLVAGRVTW